MSESFDSPALWAHTETTPVVLLAIVLVALLSRQADFSTGACAHPGSGTQIGVNSRSVLVYTPGPMAPNTVCIHCGAVGFVRREHVVKAKEAYTQHYCGLCNRAWATSDDNAPSSATQAAPTDAPDRSRP